jgi:anti-sigma regulatory factor (Ser/Thr protein kinase)/CheY-like chemotaxis protein
MGDSFSAGPRGREAAGRRGALVSPAKVMPALQKTALVIDPNREVTALLPRVFDRAEWNLEQVPNNSSALERVTEKSFDIVLTSEKTSGLEDVELLRKIRAMRPHTRMIIFAPRSTPKQVIAAMREHAFSYFTLPFSVSGVAEMVRNAMEADCWDEGIELVSATPEWIRLFARCDMKTADRLVQFVREIGGDVPEAERTALETAFREMLLNAMEHGGNFNRNEYVEISYIRTRRAVACRIRDPGKGFTIRDIPHAAVSNPPEDPFRHLEHRESKGLRPGGYGVLLAKEMVDELLYNEKGNEVVLIKYIDVASARP